MQPADDNRYWSFRMLVTFTSSETGEVLMFASTAADLLHLIGKETTARGVFTVDEMAGAAARLRAAVAEQEQPPADEEASDEENPRKPPPVSLRQRAWPLIDMLERTARSGPEAYVVWEAPQAF